MMRINKYISKCGIASRRHAEELIQQNRIKVNDIIVTELSFKVDVNHDIVKFDDKIIKLKVSKIYYLLNKPVGYTCTNTSQFGEKIIFDLFETNERIFSIGRLDKDSRGIIICTNDGDLYNKIIHPRSEVYKTYRVSLDKKIKTSDIEVLKKGVVIDGYKTQKPIIVNSTNNLVTIKIKEGKNRQIRKMFQSLGYTVVDLQRISIGQIRIGNLQEGNYRDLTEDELKYLSNL